MTISHLKILIRQDADILAVREIVDAYKGAMLDENNYVVYYNDSPTKVNELIEELYPFKYSAELHNEVF